MSALGRRIAKIETVWQRPEPPRVLCVERTPDGRLVGRASRRAVVLLGRICKPEERRRL